MLKAGDRVPVFAITIALIAAACSADHSAAKNSPDAGMADAAVPPVPVADAGHMRDGGVKQSEAAPCPNESPPKAGESDPSAFDGAAFGCHRDRERAPDGWWNGGALDDCRRGAACSYDPGDLPCGACGQEGHVCAMVAWAACDCGNGPFLDMNADAWVCKCNGGNWDCRIAAPSEEACAVCASNDASAP